VARLLFSCHGSEWHMSSGGNARVQQSYRMPVEDRDSRQGRVSPGMRAVGKRRNATPSPHARSRPQCGGRCTHRRSPRCSTRRCLSQMLSATFNVSVTLNVSARYTALRTPRTAPFSPQSKCSPWYVPETNGSFQIAGGFSVEGYCREGLVERAAGIRAHNPRR